MKVVGLSLLETEQSRALKAVTSTVSPFQQGVPCTSYTVAGFTRSVLPCKL